MNGDDEVEQLGRQAGRELAGVVVTTKAGMYAVSRRMRYIDAAALLVQLALLPAGVFSVWVFGGFAVSFVIDCVVCRRLNPARRAQRARDAQAAREAAR